MNNLKSFYNYIAIISIMAFLLHPVELFSIKNNQNRVGDQFKITMLGSNYLQINADTTIKMIENTGIKNLCIKNKHLPYRSTDVQVEAYKSKLKNANITPVSIGLIYMNKKEEVNDAFDYAKRLGVDLIICTPKHELLGYVEEKVKSFNIKVAIHVHGGDIELYPNVPDLMKYIENMDTRMGVCLDIGHDYRGGSDPFEDLKKYKNRIYDIHLKDITSTDSAGRSCEFGRGVIDIPAFVKLMRKLKYSGLCSLEFEKDKENPFLGIAESVGYLNGVLDSTVK